MSESDPDRRPDADHDGIATESVDVVEIEVADAARLVDAGLALLIDVREDDEWTAGHAPAALHIPLGRLPQTRLPADRPVLAICRSGNRSATAAALLLARGVDARNVAGGMRAWQAAGMPITSGYEPPAIRP